LISPVSLDTCLLDRPLASLLWSFFGQLSLNAIAVWTCLVSYQVPTCFSFQMLGHVVQLELPLYRALHSFKLAYNILVAISSAESGVPAPPPKLQGGSYNPIKALVAAVIIPFLTVSCAFRCNSRHGSGYRFPQGTCERRPCRRPRHGVYPYLEYFYHFVGCVFGGSRHSELKKHFFAESATMYK
jgi:hypothetical protein